MSQKMKVLFLCTGNSCRSQMAEGWARAIKGDVIEPYSAGIETHGLNPNAVKVMAEAGVDISGHRSKNVAEMMGVPFDYVVTVCDNASETCPMFPARRRLSMSASTTRRSSPPPPPRKKRLPITAGCATRSGPSSRSCRDRSRPTATPGTGSEQRASRAIKLPPFSKTSGRACATSSAGRATASRAC